MKGVPGVMVLLSHACPPSPFSGSLMPCRKADAAPEHPPWQILRCARHK